MPLCISNSLPAFSILKERPLNSFCTSVRLDLNAEENKLDFNGFKKSFTNDNNNNNNSDLQSLNSFFDKRRNSIDEMKMSENEFRMEMLTMSAYLSSLTLRGVKVYLFLITSILMLICFMTCITIHYVTG